MTILHAFVTSGIALSSFHSTFTPRECVRTVSRARSVQPTSPIMVLSSGVRSFRRALLEAGVKERVPDDIVTATPLATSDLTECTRMATAASLLNTMPRRAVRAMVSAAIVRPARMTLASMANIARRIERVRAQRRNMFMVSRMAAGLLLAIGTMVVTRSTMRFPLATAPTAPAPSIQMPAALSRAIPPSLARVLRPFSEAFGVVFLSEFGDKSMFATALMAMKHSPFLVCIGALVALTLMTLIACFLGQLMQYLPPTVTHYSSIALFVIFGFQMIMQSRNLPDVPGGSGSEREGAEQMVSGAAINHSSPLAVLAKVSSLIFVAEWCDRSMLATMALAASSNTAAVIGGATFANIICTGMAVCAATLVASRISERVVALIAGLLFEVFAVFTFLEGPEA